MPATDYRILGGIKGFNGAMQEAQARALQQQLTMAQIAKSNKPATTPADVQTFEYFKGLSPQEKTEFLRTKRAERIIDTGSGFVRYDPVTGQAITVTQPQGDNGKPAPLQKDISPAQQEKLDLKMRNDQNLLGTALAANQEQIDYVKQLFDDKGKLRPEVAANYGTVLGMRTPVVYQSTANARADLDQINAKAFMQALGAMKSQSATGASGLGSLTEKEGEKVQAAALAAADTRQSAESAEKNFKKYLKTLEDTNTRFVVNFKNIYSPPTDLSSDTVGTPPQGNYLAIPQLGINIDDKPPAPVGAPKLGEVRDGYVFLGGNPNDPKRWKQK